MRVAVIGAGGTMGAGIAANLAAAGHEVRAWNRTRERLDGLEPIDGIRACDSPGDAVDGAEAVVTMLSDGDATLGVMEEAAGSIGPAAVWVQMGTLGLEGTAGCARLAEEHEIPFVDSPVLGTKQPAEAGELIVLASGPPEVRDRVQAVFDAVGKRTIWVDGAGATTRLKVAINAWIVSVVEGTAETLALAEGLGVDPGDVLDAISGGPLDLPYMRMKGKSMMDRDFPPSFRLALAAKDARLATDAAETAGLDLPMLRAVAARMADAAEDHGEEDLAATYRLSAPAASR